MGQRLLWVMFQGVFRRRFAVLPRGYENETFNKHLSWHLSPPQPSMVRHFSKLRNKGGDKKKTQVRVNNNEISQLVDVEKLMMHFKKPIEKMMEEFVQHLSLRSTTGSLESLRVRHDGEDYELQEIAQVIRKNPKNIALHFTSFPQMIPSALKAIQASGLNLNPQQDGTTLFCPVPKITKEHREQVLKNARILYNKCKDNIKDVQNQYIKKVKNQEKVSEDLSRSVVLQIMMLADNHIEEAKTIFIAKQTELTGEK